MGLRLFVAAFAAALVLGLALAGSSGSASAHERRVVDDNYLFVVGWLNEPTLANHLNALSLVITLYPDGVPSNAGTEETEGQDLGGTPVQGAEETLNASISVGGAAQTKELTLEPALGQPGTYTGQVIPTLPGDYTFIITGTLDGVEVNETFESGPETFSTVDDPATLEFPQSTTDADNSSSNASNSENDDDNTAMIVASVAIVLAVLAGGIGIFAASRSRSP